jgi:hypothetical protein
MRTAFLLLIASSLGLLGCANDAAHSDVGSSTTGPRECRPKVERTADPAHAPATAAVERVTYQEQVTGAEIVFVGTVTASEVRDEHPKGPAAVSIPLRTTTFAIECVLRGKGEDDAIEVTEPFGEDHSSLTEGGTYLVFAETRTLLGRFERLVPMGYSQGVYPVDGDGVASNPENGAHSLNDVRRALER